MLFVQRVDNAIHLALVIQKVNSSIYFLKNQHQMSQGTLTSDIDKLSKIVIWCVLILCLFYVMISSFLLEALLYSFQSVCVAVFLINLRLNFSLCHMSELCLFTCNLLIYLGDVYDGMESKTLEMPDKKRYKRPSTGVRHTRRSASAEMIDRDEDDMVGNENLSPARRRSRRKKTHG